MTSEKVKVTDELIRFIIDTRKEYNITAYQLSEQIGKNKSWLPNIENKRTKNISKEDWLLLLNELAKVARISMDSLFIKLSKYSPANTDKKTIPNSPKRDWLDQCRTDIEIEYDGENITSLVTKKNYANITKEQRGAYLEYLNRSGHVLYARRMLLEILDELHDLSIEEISKNLKKYTEDIEENVVHWYKRCWNDIDDLFPAVNNLSTLYDLIDKCLAVDLVAQQEFTLIPIGEDFDWLRKKLG